MSVATTGRRACRGTARRRGLSRLHLAVSSALAGVLSLTAQPAAAQETETARFTPFVEETVTHDDNLFRISDQVDPLTTIGSTSRGDTWRTTSVGLNVDVPVSLQRFQASLSYNDYRYQRFHQLDYDGYALRGSWLWQIGSRLSGELGVTENYSLTPFSQLLNVAPDHLHLREEFARGAWLVTPDWKLYGAADDLNQSNSDPLAQYNNVTVDSFEVSLSRAAGTGNWFGLDTRYESGHFPVAEPIVQPLGTLFIDNGYKQYGYGVVVDIGSDTPSHVVARADRIRRDYNQVTQRNFDTTTGRIEYTWAPSVKTSVSAIAERDISPYEYIHSSIVMVKGITLRPLWHATETLDLSADASWIERTYLADPTVALAVAPSRDDHVRTVSALVAYHPAKWIAVEASYLHDARSSNIAFGDYAANVVWLKLRLSL